MRRRLSAAATLSLHAAGKRLAVAAASLQAFSPLQTLQRGYAIVSDPTTGKVVRRSRDLSVGQAVRTRLAEGDFEALVRKID